MLNNQWKLVIGICLGCSILCLFFASAALAVPQYINYQGILRDSYGNLVSGTKAMTFKIYNDLSAGSIAWSMTSPEVAVNNGIYNVQLGPLGYNELGSGRRWLEVVIGTDVLTPRLEILSVAYAVTAASADTASYATLSGSASSAATATTATNATNASVADTIDGFHASAIPTAGNLYPLDSSGKIAGVPVSAEASSPNYALFIKGKIGAAGVCVGSNSIGSGSTSTTVIDAANLSATSMVFISGGVLAGFDPTALYVYRKGADRFTVTIAPPAPVGGYPFNYLIVN